MASTVWRGHLAFGLVSFPVRLYKAARTEKVSFKRLRRAAPVETPPVEAAEPEVAVERPPAQSAQHNRAPTAHRSGTDSQRRGRSFRR